MKTPPAAGSMHLCAGQEVVPLAAVAALRDGDKVLATYRGHGWALAAGLDPFELMAEICHRQAGVNGGRSGSAYIMAPHTRFIGENSIVGAGTTIACGLAIAGDLLGRDEIVVVSIGDGAMNQGSVHEALALAAVRKLPVIFVCENNGWSELTATKDMFQVERLAQRASGYGIQGVTIDGTDPFAVRDTFALAAQRCRDNEGPVLIECRVPRLWGHYNRDIEHYRSKADKQQASDADPLARLAERLIGAGALTAADVAATYADQVAMVERLTEQALAAQTPDPSSVLQHVVAERQARPAADPGGVEEVREMTYLEAINAALRAELESDARTIVYGEDVGKAGGIFGATRYLQRDFGSGRVFDTPIAENAILGSAVGAALGGLKPIVEIMWADFLFVAVDQLVNQASNVRYSTQGRSSAPLVVRTQQGATPGSCAQHSQSIEAMLAHIPGLNVALAATPQDAYSLLRAAAADPDPCIVIEARSLYQSRGEVRMSRVPEPVGVAKRHRSGADAAIVTWGTMLARSLAAAEELSRSGIEVSVLDLRWLSPLDEEALAQVVRQSGGRVAVVHEAVKTGGFGAEVAMRINELCGGALTAPVRRIATPDVRIPASPVLQSAIIPNADTIARAVRGLVEDRNLRHQ
ncbi:MAG: thiamine pyrophosphate-dependent enzyme [Parvibaculaceae bacterium]